MEAIRVSPSQVSLRPSLSSKPTEPVQTIKSLDGTRVLISPEPETPSNKGTLKRKSVSFNDSPIWRPTKASQARAQLSAKSNRRASIVEGMFDGPATLTKGRLRKSTSAGDVGYADLTSRLREERLTQSSTSSTEVAFPSSRSQSVDDRSTQAPGTSEMYIVLQYVPEFPHSKAHGVFTDLVATNRTAIELFVVDDAGRDKETRGKVQPYLSEEGCLQWYRTGVESKGMVQVLKVHVNAGGEDENMGGTLMYWPNEKEMKDLWETSGPERRQLAGWN
ncbi:hypothetical protein VTL71DRAFT_10496 [Oculimacula yallundae]|uniref:Uncharacterized protein n=1 Tax=Oculimacula yallundae TaxID=86028 RepID=A0ABR4CUC0_9HELO